MFCRIRSIVRAAAVILPALLAARPDRVRGQEPPTKPAGDPKAADQRAALAARFNLPGVDPDVLGAFGALRAEVREDKELKGQIDWSGRKIIAVGRSIQVGNRPADILMAKRAAGIVALRNALALALGVRIGINGRVEGLKNGRVVLQGFLKGFVITKTYSQKRAGQTLWFAEVHVPMFGFKSVGGRFHDAQLGVHRQLVAGWARARWSLPAKPDETAGDLLVIDARGTGFRPSMYPVFVNADGAILLDMVTVGRQVAIHHGLCSYATTELKFERLQSALPPGLRRVAWSGAVCLAMDRPRSGGVHGQARSMPDHGTGLLALQDTGAGAYATDQNIDGLRWDRLLLAQAARGDSTRRAVGATEAPKAAPAGKAQPATAPASRPATRPATRPAEEPTVFRRRRPRRYAVRATRSSGKQKAVLVIGNRDALKMLGDPRASHLARNGRLLVVVDAAAAGVEGFLPPGRRPGGVHVAGATRR